MSEKQATARKARQKQPAGKAAPAKRVSRERRGRPANPNARAEILKAAAIAFMERGFSGTSIDDIASDIGVTKGFIYHQFESKSDLYFSIQELATRQFRDAVKLEYLAECPPDEKLLRMAHAHMTTMLDDFPAAKVGVQGLERSLMRAAGDAERRRLQRYIRTRDQYEAMLADVIRDGIAQEIFRNGDVGILARGFLGALNWTTLWFDPKRATSPGKTEEIARTLSEYAVRGLKQ